jgi:hypothetical protein
MSTFKTGSIDKALRGKGFKMSSTHHDMYWFYVGEKKTSVRTRLSHGVSEYGDSLLGQMARQLHLTRADLGDLIECPLTEDAYRQKLISGGHVKV